MVNANIVNAESRVFYTRIFVKNSPFWAIFCISKLPLNISADRGLTFTKRARINNSPEYSIG